MRASGSDTWLAKMNLGSGPIRQCHSVQIQSCFISVHATILHIYMTDYFSLNFINDQKPLFFKSELFSKEDATNLKKCKKMHYPMHIQRKCISQN